MAVVVGHRESQLSTFWESLTLLDTYITILTTNEGSFGKMVISNDPKNYMEITAELCNALNVNIMHRPAQKSTTLQTEINMQKLRELNLLDKLWNILTNCYNIGDLTICLHVLFEELAESRIHISIPDHHKTSISKIINYISTGKMAIPTLTSTQALQCLIELGIEKLKNDYLCVLNHFDCVHSENVMSYWNKISNESEKRLHDLRPSTILPTSLFDVSEIAKKVAFLTRMHTTLDFVLLAKYFKCITRDTFVYIVQCILERYMNFNVSINIRPHELCELKINLNSMSTSFLQGISPISRNFKIVTDNKSFGVSTTFHHSRQPIFPPAIYDSYDISVDAERDLVYYMSKSVTYWDKF